MLMQWKGKDLNTVGDIMDAMFACKTREEAQEFRTVYKRFEPEAADLNIGYLIGYVEPRERRNEMHQLFSVAHPIFGDRY